jgi:tRNA threonylcarbamoyladenosine biosynthesis protein TsaE
MTDDSYTLHTESAADTVDLAEAFMEILQPGDVVALTGTLGAGKTCFVKGMGRALNVEPSQVRSVSFLLMKEHAGSIPLYHFDAYRLSGAQEMEAIGCREVFEGRGVCAVEWADRVRECLPDERFAVHMHVTGAQTRRIRVRGTGPRTADRLASGAGVLARWQAPTDDETE